MDENEAMALAKTLLAALAEKANEEEGNRQAARKRMRYPPEVRLRLLIAQDHRCAICLGPVSYYESHIDHVIPMALGGEDHPNNMQLVHSNCNLRKGVRIAPGQERMPWA